MAASRTIAVAGAGIGGLTAALAIAARGYRVKLIERAESLQEIGAGLQLSPNATRVLIDLGLKDKLQSRAVAPSGISIMTGASGRELAQLPIGEATAFRYGAPYWVMHRADLQAALREAVDEHPDVELCLGSTFEDVAAHSRGLTVVYRRGHQREQDVVLALVGADGVWSTVRNHLRKPVQPQFSGYIVWRGMADTGPLPRAQKSDRVQLWLGADAHLVAYPMRGGRQVNLVAIMRGTWNRPGWSEPGDAGEINRAFSYGQWSSGARLLINAVENWRRFALFAMPSSVWGDGKIALLGDASHAMLPFIAQGAGSAIEDAAVLASCLAREPYDQTAAIVQYGAARHARINRIMRAARRNGSIYHLQGVAAFARNLAISTLGGRRILEQHDWIYDWQA